MEPPPGPPLRSINPNIEAVDEVGEETLTPDQKCILLQRNDPGLEEICFGTDTNDLLPHAEDWGKFGDCISKNTHLKSIKFCYLEDLELETEPTLDQYEQLFKGLSDNQSIHTLSISSLEFYGNELPAMLPVLKKSPTLVSLELGAGGGEIDLGGDAGRLLAETLASFDSLGFFEICGTSVSSDASRGIVEALSNHRCLTELKMYNILRKFRQSYEALALLLQRCLILELLAIHDKVGDKCASILAVALALNVSLKTLDLSMTDTCETGWFAISTLLLMNKRTNIESVSFVSGWFQDGICTEAMSSMAANISHTKKLKTINIAGNRRIDMSGWKPLFEYLEDSSCFLEKLNIADTNMNNERMGILCAALAKNSSLTDIDISGNRNITIGGLREIGRVLQSSHSALLHIGIDPLDDEKSILFSGFLSSSGCKLESITSPYTGNDNEVVTRAGLKAFERTLCNNSSIMATYNSNHTLQDVALYQVQDEKEKENLNHLLSLNMRWIQSYCARLKILEVHFNGKKENVKPFFDMPMELLPYAMSWIGDTHDHEEDVKGSRTLMYHLIGSMPSLFDFDGKKKRKRTKQGKVSDYFGLNLH